ncbi:MAG TPA: hypothetical protein VG013_27200 [Gemmataceae bacterium]|nr:hypothetical protein [Gemmataceae bacterium]
MALEREYELFERQMPDYLREHAGEYVLIHGDDVSFWKTGEEAYDAGVLRFGVVPMLIEKIEREPPDYVIVSHPTIQCRS